MSSDVAKLVVTANSGKEGSAIIASGGTKIVPAFASRRRVVPKVNNVVTDTTLFAKYDNKFS